MGADHFREATKKLYDVELLRAVAAAVVVTAVASCVLVRGRNAECRNRARVVICQLPAHIVTQIERLSVLACRKLRNKELLQAIEQSKHSFEEIMDFLSTDGSQD